MTRVPRRHNLSLAAAIALSVAAFSLPQTLLAQGVPEEDQGSPAPAPTVGGEGYVAQLLADLSRPDNAQWRATERKLLTEWGKSGSAAMDLLLKRGRDALDEDDLPAAIGHLTALTDHAPDFAEGWVMRATALYRSGYFGPAMSDLARALALNPQHFGALTGVARILGETGDKTRALQAYRRALSIHPNLGTVRDAAAQLEAELTGRKL